MLYVLTFIVGLVCGALVIWLKREPQQSNSTCGEAKPDFNEEEYADVTTMDDTHYKYMHRITGDIVEGEEIK